MKTDRKLHISFMILVLVVSSSIAQESVDYEVIAKIRKLLARQAGFRVTDDELRIAIVENILQF